MIDSIRDSHVPYTYEVLHQYYQLLPHLQAFTIWLIAQLSTVYLSHRRVAPLFISLRLLTLAALPRARHARTSPKRSATSTRPSAGTGASYPPCGSTGACTAWTSRSCAVRACARRYAAPRLLLIPDAPSGATPADASLRMIEGASEWRQLCDPAGIPPGPLRLPSGAQDAEHNIV
jgi:hypothetical protein